jgi:hypothetical protein
MEANAFPEFTNMISPALEYTMQLTYGPRANTGNYFSQLLFASNQVQITL